MPYMGRLSKKKRKKINERRWINTWKSYEPLLRSDQSKEFWDKLKKCVKYNNASTKTVNGIIIESPSHPKTGGKDSP